MQRLLRILIVIGLLTPAFSFSAVMAHDSASNSGGSGSSTTTQADDNALATTDTGTDTETPTTTLAERLTEHKSEFKQNLTRLQIASLKTRCKAAQGQLSSLSGRIKGIQTSRNEVYTNLTKHLASLQTKLQERDVDTTELQAEIATLRTKIDTYKTDLVAYKQAVSDLSDMDCNADPTAFKATLEAARAARKKVATDITDIHSYVIDTIKPTLVKIRTSLAAGEQKTDSQGAQSGN